MSKDIQIGDRLATTSRLVAINKMVEFESVVWVRGQNSHNDPAAARKDGLTNTIASGQNQMAFLHEMLERNFGDGWVFGGTISVRYIHPVYAGDHITPNGTVTGIEESDGSRRVQVEVWCENQKGEKTAAGRVETGWPVDKMSWLETGAAQAVAQ